MAVYELTIRFEAGDGREAMEFAADVESAVKGEAVLTPMSWAHQKCAVERLTRIIVTHMPLDPAQARIAGEPC